MNAKVIGAIGAVVVFGGIILGAMSFTSIGAGHAGVVWSRNGGIEDKPLGQGWHFVNPLVHVTEYPVATETVQYEDIRLGTSDGKPIQTTISYSYHIELDKLPQVFNKFRGQGTGVIEQGFLKQRLIEAAKDVTTKYSVLEVLGEKSQEVSLAIQKGFAEDAKVVAAGFVIESVTFQTPTPDDQTQKAIQAKVDAEQKLEQEKINLEKEKIMADQKRVTAQGEADSALIVAQGQAKANALLNQSLTDKVIQNKTIDKWDGKLPAVSGSNSMVQVPLPNSK
jgi:regulator of protease activity HflC (stomatin/prohibitin superfamily)